MTQPNLRMRWRSTAHTKCAVFKEIDGQLIQIGSEFGDCTGLSMGEGVAGKNRAVHWENDLYAIDQSAIWKYDVANSGDWGVFHALDNPTTYNDITKAHQLGFTACSINGEPLLVTGYCSDDGIGYDWVKIVRITSSGVFEDAAFDVNPAQGFHATVQQNFNDAIQWRNNLVWGQGDGYAILYNLETKNATITARLDTNKYTGALCVFRDNIWALGYGGPGGDNSTRLARLDGSNWTVVASFAYNCGYALAKYAMIPYGNNHICCFGYSTSLAANVPYPGDPVGQRMFSWVIEFPPDSTSSATYTWTMKEVLDGDFGGYTSSNVRVSTSHTPKFYTSTELLSGDADNPVYEIDFSTGHSEGSTSVDIFRFYPPSGSLEFVAGGMDAVRHSRINNVDSTGGEHIWPGSGTLNVSPPILSTVGANIYATYDIYGDASASGLVVLELLYDKEGEHTFSRGTLIATSEGVLNGNYASGLSPGDHVSVVWAASIDGIELGDNPKVSAHVFIP